MSQHDMQTVNPDDDVYVASLIRLGAADDVVDRARKAVTDENFVRNPDSPHQGHRSRRH